MKALVLEEYNCLRYKDVPEPTTAENEVLVAVRACGICGSDVHGMDGSSGRRMPPIIMGHEAAGVIVKVGAAVDDWHPGDRVTFDSTIYRENDWYSERGMYNLSDNRMVLGVSCPDFRRNGAFAEYVAVPRHILYRLPEEVSFEQAAMVEPVAVALHAVSLSGVRPEDAILVVGAGMIGLFIVQVLKARGCRQIIAVDLEDEKLVLAQELGARHVFNAANNPESEVSALTDTRGADVVLEAVGIEATVKLAVASVRKGGSIVLVGNIAPTVELPLQSVVTRQIRLQGSCAICGEYPEALSLIASGQVAVERVISAKVPLSDGADWFRRLYQKEKGLMKVLLCP